MKNIIITDVVNDVTYSRKNFNTCTRVVITILLQDVIHWKTAMSCGYREAGLRLCFRICKLLVF